MKPSQLKQRVYVLATVFGDPHIITFDKLEYTFNGKGEYVLVHVNSTKAKFDVQGRFEQLPQNIYGFVNATQLTSIVGKSNHGKQYMYTLLDIQRVTENQNAHA